MNRFANMSVKSSEEVIPIPQELVQKHIMNMLQYHVKVSNCHAKENKLLKSEVESLRNKAWASAKDTEMDIKAMMEDIQDNTRWCWFYDRNTCLDFPERSVEEKLASYGKHFIPSVDEHRTSLESMEQFLLVHKCISRRSGQSEEDIYSIRNEKNGKEMK
jgi:hypothetical protein